MEKISNIVRGNARVSSVDMKDAAPVRPGTPSFGRPMGTSSIANNSGMTTAQRAVALHNEIQESKKTKGIAESEFSGQMADQFFVNRARRDDLVTPGVGVGVGTGIQVQTPAAGESTVAVGVAAEASEESEASPRYMPRGSYIDTHA